MREMSNKDIRKKIFEKARERGEGGLQYFGLS
jgi:hypothetical protein